MKFELEHTLCDSRARAGVLHTDHGAVPTPIFMPVGTAAAMKGIFHRDLKSEAQAHIILANTYHLYLRPGMEIIRACRRRAPFLDVGRPDADRQRRLSGLFAGRMPQTQRGGLPLPLAYRRVASSVHARERHRHRAHHRRRHHDGVRRVSSGRCAARLCGQVAGHDRAVARPLLRPLPTDAAQVRPLSGSVPDRAGVLVSRSQGSAPPATCCNTMPTDTP